MVLTTDELRGMSRDELYKRGRSIEDALHKRLKRLEKNINEKPGEYSDYGYKKLKGGNGDPGIPNISKKDHMNTLRSKVARAEKLKDMKSTSSKGAKEVIKESVRRINDLPLTGKLKKVKLDDGTVIDQKKIFDENMQYVKDNPGTLNDFWDAFKKYQDEMQHAGMYSGKELAEFKKLIDRKAIQDGVSRIESLADIMREQAEALEEELGERDDLDQEYMSDSLMKG